MGIIAWRAEKNLRWCANLVLKVLFICVSTVSVILKLLYFPVSMILMKKPNVVHIIYLSSINMQFTKLQVRPLQVNQNWHTHRLNYLPSHKMDFVVQILHLHTGHTYHALPFCSTQNSPNKQGHWIGTVIRDQ